MITIPHFPMALKKPHSAPRMSLDKPPDKVAVGRGTTRTVHLRTLTQQNTWSTDGSAAPAAAEAAPAGAPPAEVAALLAEPGGATEMWARRARPCSTSRRVPALGASTT